MADKKINVGVIGYGCVPLPVPPSFPPLPIWLPKPATNTPIYSMSAKVFHIPLILTTPSMTLHSILQRTPTASNDASKDHPSAKIHRDIDSLLSDPEVDLIVITTTPDSHFELCKQSLEKGKHVLVEKPFVPTAAQADALIAIAKSHHRLLCIYQNRRWDSDFLTFRHLYAEGKGVLGRIVEFESHFDRYKPERPRNWKGQLGMQQAGGVLYDLGTHLIDQIVCTFGLPEKVTGIFSNQRNDGDEEPDSITVLMHYGNGMLATAKAGVMSISTEQLRFWVRGTKGSYLKHHLDVQEDQLKAGLKPGDDGFGIEDPSRDGELHVLGDDGKVVKTSQRNVKPETYAVLYRRFADAILMGEEAGVPVKASEARDVLRVIEAARRSAGEGRTVEL
jgi:predicted dehydrogenase